MAIDGNDTAIDRNLDVVDQFRAWVDRSPDAHAVESASGHMTYRELFERACAIAQALAAIKTPPRVVIFHQAGGPAYAAILGTLLAGGTFCPISTDQPDARANLMMTTFQPDVVITEGGNSPLQGAVPTVDPEAVGTASAGFIQGLKPGAQAGGGYVIFTSGSTGMPKGVQVPRRCIAQFVVGFSKYLDVRPTDRWAQFSKLGFDLSIVDLFMTLTNGATLVPLTGSYRLNPAACIRDFAITIWHSVPSVIDLIRAARRLDSEHLSSLRIASFCGEPLKQHVVEGLFAVLPDLLVLNTYGPTEGTLFCTAMPLRKADHQRYLRKTFSVGSALEGWSIDLVGSDGRTGEEGEIYVSGNFLSDGYLANEAATSEKFIRGAVLPGVMSYTTGDWAERIDGMIFFQGRMDRQVKIQGNRMELAEVEFHLQALVQTNCYVFMDDGKIVAAIEGTQPPSVEQLRIGLKHHLPDFAVPSRVLAIEKFPRNGNDKIDLAALSRAVADLRPATALGRD
jgi:D-alanine--poly(phosphoribitol) ligase subunit 1